MEQSFLRDAIDEYCKKHNISVELANDYVCGKAREGNIPGDFWDEVCAALPQRTKNSIQRAAKRVFRNNQKKGAWTNEEEIALEQAYRKAPDQWAKICEEVPGRSAEQCRDRWRNYTQNGGALTRGPWTDDEETRFINICKNMLRDARVDREHQRQLGRTISTKFDPIDHLNFTAISVEMEGKRSRLHCRNKWHKLKKRPDVEAAIEAIIQGDVAAIEKPDVSVTPKTTLAPISASASLGSEKTSLPTNLPPVSQTLGSLMPPRSGPNMPAATLSSGLSQYAQALSNPQLSAVASQLYGPTPSYPLSHLQGQRPSSAKASESRPVSASVPPPAANTRPSLPPPVPSAPAVPRSSALPAIMAPFADPRPTLQVSAASSAPSAAPSWANAPPRVPQLFKPGTVASKRHVNPPSEQLDQAALKADAFLSRQPAGLCAPFARNSFDDTDKDDTSLHASRTDSRRSLSAMNQSTHGPVLPPLTSAVLGPRRRVSNEPSINSSARETSFSPFTTAPAAEAQQANGHVAQTIANNRMSGIGGVSHAPSPAPTRFSSSPKGSRPSHKKRKMNETGEEA